MSPAELAAHAVALDEYLHDLLRGLGRRERRAAAADYVRALLLDGRGKSVQGLAARLAPAPDQADALRQRLQGCLIAGWSDAQVRRRLIRRTLPDPRLGALLLAEIAFTRDGPHSIGVARQAAAALGRIARCQRAIALARVGPRCAVALGLDLYLPLSWADDQPRRRRAGVPPELSYREPHEIALGLLDEVVAAGLPRQPVLAGASLRADVRFRDGLAHRGFEHLLAPPRTVASARHLHDTLRRLGLYQFAGRTWRGFHHHATLCAVAQCFLSSLEAGPEV